jgi:hypothetical protein
MTETTIPSSTSVSRSAPESSTLDRLHGERSSEAEVSWLGD